MISRITWPVGTLTETCAFKAAMSVVSSDLAAWPAISSEVTVVASVSICCRMDETSAALAPAFSDDTCTVAVASYIGVRRYTNASAAATTTAVTRPIDHLRRRTTAKYLAEVS